MTRFAPAALSAVLGFVLLIPAADAARHRRHPAKPPAQVQQPVAVAAVPVATAGTLVSSWTQYGPDGVLEARAVVQGPNCPLIYIDLHRSLMSVRAAADQNFRTVCAAAIPAGSKQVALALPFQKSPPPSPSAGSAAMKTWIEAETGTAMPGPAASEAERQQWRTHVADSMRYDIVPVALPAADPQRILVLGDTGCRIKGKDLQACSDPEAWPFARIASEAAKLKPDLVIHVGDYLYREQACPADFPGCKGTPWGDNWPSWDADFFTPAKPLLSVAPWVIVRGNHEDCQRAGPGFLRLLGPTAFDPAAPCADHLPQYAVPLARVTLMVMDNVDAPETSVQGSIQAYRQEIAALAGEKRPVWWLQHRPIWGVITGPLGVPAGGNLSLMAAVGSAGIPESVELMLAGHIHTFEAINYAPQPHVPPQIVAGFGGDNLDSTPSNLRGTVFQGSSGVHVRDGLSVGGFGFLLMTRMEDGWRLDVYDSRGRIERVCSFRNERLDCPAP